MKAISRWLRSQRDHTTARKTYREELIEIFRLQLPTEELARSGTEFWLPSALMAQGHQAKSSRLRESNFD